MFYTGLMTTKSAQEAHKSEPTKLQYQAIRELLDWCTLVEKILVTGGVVIVGVKGTTLKNLQVCSTLS